MSLVRVYIASKAEVSRFRTLKLFYASYRPETDPGHRVSGSGVKDARASGRVIRVNEAALDQSHAS